MRKIAFLLLLATVATPSFARDPDSDREARREKAEAERASVPRPARSGARSANRPRAKANKSKRFAPSTAAKIAQ